MKGTRTKTALGSLARMTLSGISAFAVIATSTVAAPAFAAHHKHHSSESTEQSHSRHHAKHHHDEDAQETHRSHHHHDEDAQETHHGKAYREHLKRLEVKKHREHEEHLAERHHHQSAHERRLAEKEQREHEARLEKIERRHEERVAESDSRHHRHHSHDSASHERRLAEHNRRLEEHNRRLAAREERYQERLAKRLSHMSAHQRKVTVQNMALHSGNVVKAACAFEGSRYVFGGTSRSGFDCSGFTRYILGNTAGVDLPRTAMEQYYNGTPVDRDDMKAGDLVFFRNTYRHGISHVGIYTGDGHFVHAANSHKGVVVESLDSPYYQEHYAGARRVTSRDESE